MISCSPGEVRLSPIGLWDVASEDTNTSEDTNVAPEDTNVMSADTVRRMFAFQKGCDRFMIAERLGNVRQDSVPSVAVGQDVWKVDVPAFSPSNKEANVAVDAMS